MQKRTKVLITVLVAIGVLAAVGMGTFATFTAQTTNPAWDLPEHR